jgi:hypothetical protein
MLRAAVAILLLLACAASADETTPTDLQVIPLAVRDGRIVCNSDDARIEASGLDPWFLWEGRSSHLTVTSSPTGVTIFWHLDIIGPDWFDLTIVDTGCAVTVTASHSAGRFREERRTYATWSDLLEDRKDDVRWIVIACLHRIGRDGLFRLWHS